MEPANRGKTSFVARLIADSRDGGLATLSARMPGYPYATSTAIAADASHRPWMLLSRLSEHRSNLECDSRASLHLVESDAASPLSAARITLVGNIARASDIDPMTLDYLLARQPDWAQLLALGDFDFFVLEWTQCRAIQGFGRMRWIAREEILSVSGNDEDWSTRPNQPTPDSN